MKTPILNFSAKQLSTLVCMGFVLFSTSCDDNEDSDVNPETKSEKKLDDSAFSENVMTEVSFDVDEAIGFGGLSNGRTTSTFQGCATIEIDIPEDEDYPIIITLDFGDGCESGRGTTKSGKMIINITDDIEEPGTQVIQTFEDYHVNGYKIEGTNTRTTVDESQYIIVLENGRVTIPEEGSYTIESTRTYNTIEGQDTSFPFDDIFEITGPASGITSNGESYTREITTTLVKSRLCPWVASGVIETIIGGDETRTLDFGDGECDDLAMLTTAEGTEEIEMDFSVIEIDDDDDDEDNEG